MEFKNYEPADIEIHIKDKGMVLREKSLVAFTQHDGKILAFGAEAEEIAKKNIDGVQVLSPLRQGMLADYHVAVSMFRHMIKKTWGKRPFSKPHIIVFVPKNMTEVEKKALEEVMYQVGAKELSISDVSFERFRDDMTAMDKKRYLSYDLFIVITKDEPEKYISEQLSNILNYAAQEGIPVARVEELLKAQNHDLSGNEQIGQSESTEQPDKSNAACATP